MNELTIDDFCRICTKYSLHTILGEDGKYQDRYAGAYACSGMLEKVRDIFCIWDGISFSNNGVAIGYYDSLVLTKNGTYRISTSDGSGLLVPIRDARHLHEVCKQFDYALYALEQYPSYRPKTITIKADR